ncbi:hypothetical protein Q5752_004066 [Cryptotrichosporon argae]
MTAGIIGFASPLLTSVFYGSDTAKDSLANAADYLPWFYKAVNESLVAPYFSIALERTSFANEETNISLTNTSVTVPNIEFTADVDGETVTAPAYYTVSADSFTINNVSVPNSAAITIILDSGTTLVYVPDDVAEAFAAAISPAAIYDSDLGAYIASCDARVPETSVQIGGETFTFTAADLLYPLEGNECYATLLPSGSAPGTVFVL